MITLTREEAQQVLDALETLAKYEHPEHKIQIRKPKNGGHIVTVYPHKLATDGAETLRARLAQHEEERAHPELWDEKDTAYRPGGLAQPEPEPVAGYRWEEGRTPPSVTFTAPPQREWQGLTTDELQEIAEFHFHGGLSGREFYDDIEAKLKEKNNG